MLTAGGDSPLKTKSVAASGKLYPERIPHARTQKTDNLKKFEVKRPEFRK